MCYNFTLICSYSGKGGARMRFAYQAFVVLIVLMMWAVGLPAETLGTEARIEEKGKDWIIYKGRSHGVEKGMDGYLMKKVYSSETKKFIPRKIAHFRITRVFSANSYAQVSTWNEGFTAKDAQWARFIKTLKPPVTSKPAPKAKPTKKIATGKTQRYYLGEGDNAYNKGNYDLAMKYYNKVLEIDPEDPGAKMLMKKARGRYMLEQGDLDYKKKESGRAYEYYVMAFQVMEKDNYMAAEKILDLWQKESGYYERIKEFELEPGVLMGSLFNRCDGLLEEKQLDQLAALAGKMLPYASGDTEKNKLDTFSAAKEIGKNVEDSQFGLLINTAESAIDSFNFFKASFIIEKLDKAMIDDATREKLSDLKEKLRVQKGSLALKKATQQREDKIKSLTEEARGYVALKDYDKAIQRYEEIYKLEPENKEHGEKIKKLLQEQFDHKQKLARIEADTKRNRWLLHAQSSTQKELLQDALDYYVKAYKILPEPGKALDGIIKILETCGDNDAKYITPQLLDRKLSKFSKDFLGVVEKRYLGTKDQVGFNILSRIVFVNNNKTFDQLLVKFRENLYAINLKAGHEQFRKAVFEEATAFYTKALGHKDTGEVKSWLTACAELKKIDKELRSNRKKELGQYFDTLSSHDQRYKIVEGVINLSEFYMDKFDFKKSKYLYKKGGSFQYSKFSSRLSELKEKEKELKKQAKQKK